MKRTGSQIMGLLRRKLDKRASEGEFPDFLSLLGAMIFLSGLAIAALILLVIRLNS